MTEYSDRSKELAEQLRQKALRNLGQKNVTGRSGNQSSKVVSQRQPRTAGR